jgi:hypothetical protein
MLQKPTSAGIAMPVNHFYRSKQAQTPQANIIFHLYSPKITPSTPYQHQFLSNSPTLVQVQPYVMSPSSILLL